jgi:hypothetical protein
MKAIKNVTGAVKVVFVHTYHRFRHGRWELVTSHYRSWPTG